MVSRVRTHNRRVLPRDEIVTRGLDSALNVSHAPYTYKMKFKSGTSRTRTGRYLAKNRLELFAKMIIEHAENGRDFFVFDVKRDLRYQVKARDF